LAVRVRLRIRAGEREVVTNALVNTGFETEEPLLLLPVRLAEVLDLWPPPENASRVLMGTAGGPIYNFQIHQALEVSVIEEDREVGPVGCDALVSQFEAEVLINDKLGEALGLVILRMGEGVWRFSDDPPGRERRSVSPQYWP